MASRVARVLNDQRVPRRLHLRDPLDSGAMGALSCISHASSYVHAPQHLADVGIPLHEQYVAVLPRFLR